MELSSKRADNFHRLVGFKDWTPLTSVHSNERQERDEEERPKSGCQFLSDTRDKINSPLFQTSHPYQFPTDTGQIQIQPLNKSKSNTCNKSCWPPRTNPAAAASDKSKCVRWTNRICAPTQIRALRPRPCKGGGAPPGLGWNIHEHFTAWQRQFDKY